MITLTSHFGFLFEAPGLGAEFDPLSLVTVLTITRRRKPNLAVLTSLPPWKSKLLFLSVVVGKLKQIQFYFGADRMIYILRKYEGVKREKYIFFSLFWRQRGGGSEIRDIYIPYFCRNPKGSRNKKFMAGPLRPNPSPPSSLMAVENMKNWKNGSKKRSFFLNAPFTPSPS